MKKLLFYITFILIAQAVAGQEDRESFMLEQEAVCREMLEEASASLDKTKQENARQLALEALEAAEMSGNADLQVEAALLLREIYTKKNNQLQALEYGLIAYEYAAGASDQLKTTSGIALIECYTGFGASASAGTIAEQLMRLPVLTETKKTLLITIATAAIQAGDYQKAHETWIDLLHLAKEYMDDALILKSLEQLSEVNLKRLDYDKAIKYENELYFKVLWMGQHQRAAVCANNIALTYHRKQDFKAAQYHFKMALDDCGRSSAMYCEVLLNKAATCLSQNDAASALSLVEEAVEKSRRFGHQTTLAKSLTIYATLLQNEGNVSGAFVSANESYDLALKSGNRVTQSEALTLLSELALAKGDKVLLNDFNQFKTELQKQADNENRTQLLAANNLALTLEKIEGSANTYVSSAREKNLQRKEQLLTLENQQKDRSLLQAEQELHKAELDRLSISKQKAQQALALAELRLREQKQLSSIMELEKSKSEQLLSFTQLELQKKDQESAFQLVHKQNQVLQAEGQLQEQQAKQDSLIKKILISVALLMIFCFAFAIHAFLKSRKKNQIIKRQNLSIKQNNAQLKEKNDDILNSINYASFFQESIMPKEGYLQLAFSEGFIYYKPLDVVSGDLPFFFEKDNKVYIAAIDCIGHGVPAAMLSFMVHYNLVDIITNSPEASTGEILSRLNRVVLASLEKETNQKFNAGVDMAIVKCTKGETEIEYAGAQSPLFYQSDQDLVKIKADYFSVGDTVLKKQVEFKTHRLQLKKNDRIYLMSDGYIHQHGGSDGFEKYGTRKFMKLINEFSRLNMSELKNKISDVHETWKGNSPQTDDVMVIGITL